MNTVIREWMETEGKKFLKEIGIKEGNKVLDFGCGEGHYTIPLAEVVGKRGIVYAIDKDAQVLTKLKKIIKEKRLKNIKLINENTKIPLENNSIDVVLCYDVIHYEDKQNRKKIYEKIYRVLKFTGFFSLYPKHHKKDYPLMELAQIELEEVIGEVESMGFVLEKKLFKKCIHDDYYNKCCILNFKKKRRN